MKQPYLDLNQQIDESLVGRLNKYLDNLNVNIMERKSVADSRQSTASTNDRVSEERKRNLLTLLRDGTL